jgi:N utilization substance protein B
MNALASSMFEDDNQKKGIDPRHARRLRVVQHLFAHSFGDEREGIEALHPEEAQIVQMIFSYREVLDALIQKHAPKYPLSQIARSDLAILRLAAYELIIDRKEPDKVVINEAVELAKEVGSDRGFAFVNAVLGKILTEYKNGSDENPVTQVAKKTP